MEFITRHLTPKDEPLIYNSFLQSHYKHFPMSTIPQVIYYKEQSKIIKELLSTASVVLAVYPEDSTEIMSYVIYEYSGDALVIHYAFTKFANRHHKVATRLVQELLGDLKLIVCTHVNSNFRDLKKSIPGVRMIYDPFFLRRSR